MPFNIPGLLVPFQLLIYPRLVVPDLAVKDIRHIEFRALRKAGFRGAVFDKDNCLTEPHKDKLVPELQNAWQECREIFGNGNILIVSNSAGTPLDVGGIQAESVTHHLKVPVLCHASFKPSYSCMNDIRAYFSSLPNPIQDTELIVVGDRIFTDVVLANRMRRRRNSSEGFIATTFSCAFQKGGTVVTEKETLREYESPLDGPMAIWTTGVWTRESMVMRWLETSLLGAVKKWSKTSSSILLNVDEFTKPVIEESPQKRKNILAKIIIVLRTLR